MTRLGTVASVIRGEGLASALRRTHERIGEAVRDATLQARGAWTRTSELPILNIAASGTSTRLGGLQAQLVARLAIERGQRAVALLRPGILELSRPVPHARRVPLDLAVGIQAALTMTGAGTLHFEGTSDVSLPLLMRLIESGRRVILGIHDFSLFCARPHLLEEPARQFCFDSQDLDRCRRCLSETWDVSRNEQAERRALARQILDSAHGLVFPSHFLLEQHRVLFRLPELRGEVIEPGVPLPKRDRDVDVPGRAIAFAGSAKHHKGIHLLPDLARLARGIRLHVFGGGDESLLRDARRIPNATVHGYYRAGELPSLLAAHGVGMVIVPSIWPEAYCLVISEAWSAGAAVAAFDLGAQAERIRRDGGGWLTPLERGAEGLASIVERWRAGQIATAIPPSVASPDDAARAHLDFYRG